MTEAPGLQIEFEGHSTLLKWHRLRRRMADPLFSAEVMAEGFRAGASMELDAMTQALLMTTHDHAEFHAAFNEKRPPRWEGR